MGMDIYAGTFVRYYAKNWKTKSQQFCEENGIAYSVIRANPEEHEKQASPEKITEGVHYWQNKMNDMLESHGIQRFELWEENNEKDYYTDKPDWDAFGALLLMVSAKVLGRDCPAEYEKNMEFHPYIEEAAAEMLAEWSLPAGVFHFIPQKEYLMFEWVLANGKEASFATTATLKAELDTINELLWNADENMILEWTETEGYPVDVVLQNGKYQRLQESKVYDTESLAKFCYSILYRAVKFSFENNVPVIFDY